jgi:hypothetical protein
MLKKDWNIPTMLKEEIYVLQEKLLALCVAGQGSINERADYI